MDFVLDVEVLWNFSFETNKKSEDEEEKKKMNDFFPKSEDVADISFLTIHLCA